MPLTRIKSLGITDGTILGADINSTFDLTGKTVTLPAGTGGKVLQVVQAKYSTATTTTSASLVTTNISGSITPSSTSNKIFIIATFFSSVPTGGEGVFSIFRGATNLAGGTNNIFGQNYSAGGRSDYMSCLTFLDSPSTTSSTTYAVYFKSDSGHTITTTGEGTESIINLIEIAG